MIEDVKKIPYGVSNLVEVAEQNQHYVDRTMYLPLLEQQLNSLLFIRPRRSDKSIFLSMLRIYYDISRKGKFQKRFGSLQIGSQPTPLQKTFQILFPGFPRISGIGGTLAQNFDDYCCGGLDDFTSIYELYYYPGLALEMKQLEGLINKLSFLDWKARNNDSHLYLIIGEYDNFTNVVLDEQGNEVYYALTHASGFYREIFKKFKGMLECIFVTGVSPVTLDDLTGGLNIGWNINTDFQLNMVLGFSETDVRAMFQYYKDAGQLPTDTDIDALIRGVKLQYNDYCFARENLERGPKMLNCDVVPCYLHHYITLGKSPEQMIDPNTHTDYNKMKKLIRLGKPDGSRKGVLRKIAEEGEVTTSLVATFLAGEIANPEIFPSLLSYYGILITTGIRGVRLIPGILNNDARKQCYDFLLEEYQKGRHIDLNGLRDSSDDMTFDSHWQKSLEFIAHAYRENSSVRNAIEDERNVQGFFTTYLSVNVYYLTAPEVGPNHGYHDLFLMPDLLHYEISHNYIIELRYLSEKDSDAKAEIQQEEAVKQIKGYAVAPKIRQLIQNIKLHCIVM